jgi:hypothetical protein
VVESPRDTSRRRRSAGEPYSQERRLQRGNKIDKGVDDIPRCVENSRGVPALTLSAGEVTRGRRARSKRCGSLPSSEPSLTSSRIFIAPKLSSRSRSQSTILRKSKVDDIEDGYPSADEASSILSIAPGTPDYLNQASAPRSCEIKEEDVMTFLQSALAFIPPEALFPKNIE